MKKTKIMLVGLGSLLLLMLLSGVAFSEEKSAPGDPALQSLGTIKGQILRVGGGGFSPGFVAFFDSENLEPMDYGQTRRSPKMVAFLNETGQFTTNLMPSGSYYVGAMERTRWRGGPPQKGEKRFSAFDEKGKYLIVTLAGGQNLDIGSVVVKEPTATPELTSFFTIEGRLLDEAGKGVADSVVIVKRDLNTAKAEFISDKSAANGAYRIKLPPGKYFLLARETVAGSMRPKPDSIYGELGQLVPIGIGGKSNRPSSFITGTAGQEYKNVDIVMFKIPVPDVKRKETESLVKADKYSKGNLSENLPLRKKPTDSVVESDIRPQAEKEKENPKDTK